MRIHFALALALCTGFASAQTMIPLPTFSSTFSASATRGFYFQAPVSFIITGLRVPDETNHGLQNVEVYLMQSAPPAYPATGNTGQVFYATGVPSNQIISTSILVQAGEFVGILGACGDAATMHNSYGAGSFASSLMGNPITLERFLTQFNLVSSGGNQPYSSEPGGSIARVEVYYTPPTGLYTAFTATPTSGATPLAVQFTDTTFTSDPGGILTWAWDFESDGIVDSTIQNPQATYNTCGYYDVTLTTTDSMHSPSTLMKPAFIQADPQLLVNANFIATPNGGAPPLQVQFTDSSTGTPTSWSWDLDGDGVIDSTLQNPTFTYNTGGGYTVSLTVSNACGSDTEIRTNFIFVMVNDECAGALPVTFGANGPFDSTSATVSAGVQAWSCAGGGGPDLWFSFTPTCTGNVDIDLCGSGYDTALELFSGSCGALTWIACNDDFCGLQSGLSLTPAVAGTTYYLRVGGYSGNTGSFVINISINGNGSFSTIATGCGQATLDANGSPNIGGSVSYTMNGLMGTPLIWVGTIPLNNPLCPAGCALGTTFDIIIPAQSISGPLPCLPFIQGAVFYVQGADLNAPGGCMPPVSPLPMTFTDTVVTTIG